MWCPDETNGLFLAFIVCVFSVLCMPASPNQGLIVFALLYARCFFLTNRLILGVNHGRL